MGNFAKVLEKLNEGASFGSETEKCKDGIVSGGIRDVGKAYNDKRTGGNRVKVEVDFTTKVTDADISKIEGKLKGIFGDRFKGVRYVKSDGGRTRPYFAIQLGPKEAAKEE